MNDGKLEHAKFRKVGLNNRLSLSHSNILQGAHQWARFCVKKCLVVTLAGNLFHMCKSLLFYPILHMGRSVEVYKYDCQESPQG